MKKTIKITLEEAVKELSVGTPVYMVNQMHKTTMMQELAGAELFFKYEDVSDPVTAEPVFKEMIDMAAKNGKQLEITGVIPEDGGYKFLTAEAEQAFAETEKPKKKGRPKKQPDATSANDDQIAELFEQGLSYEKIAEQAGCKFADVVTVLREKGLIDNG